jgi:hypothetical protein
VELSSTTSTRRAGALAAAGLRTRIGSGPGSGLSLESVFRKGSKAFIAAWGVG